jgi:hypothetical protein
VIEKQRAANWAKSENIKTKELQDLERKAGRSEDFYAIPVL